MSMGELKPNKILHDPISPEKVQLLVAVAMGCAVKLVPKGNALRA